MGSRQVAVGAAAGYSGDCRRRNRNSGSQAWQELRERLEEARSTSRATRRTSGSVCRRTAFRWVKEHVYPMRQQNRRDAYREYWWRHVEPRQGMWRALNGLSRYIATPTVAKYRLFAWYDVRICPDHQLIVGLFAGGGEILR